MQSFLKLLDTCNVCLNEFCLETKEIYTANNYFKFVSPNPN